MSKGSLRERNKAIRLAWEREQELVSEGKGTRDWSLEQQRDILDPNKGKAYDENGRAFEGQHMKSATEYPEYQGNPDNIQFLTRDEHLAAHKGSWQNPTNWYYNPETKEFLDFGNGGIIPCKIIELTNSITNAKISDVDNRSNTYEASQKVEKIEEAPSGNEDVNSSSSRKKQDHTVVKNASQKKRITAKPTKRENILIKGLKNHKDSLNKIIGAVLTIGAVGTISVLNSKRHSKRNINRTNPNTNSTSPVKSDIVTQVSDIAEKATHSSPKQHIVPPGGQHYHTKEGVIWKEKDAYLSPKDP